MYGPLPVAGLRGFLSEEEIYFVVVSVVVVWDEVGSDELGVCREKMEGCRECHHVLIEFEHIQHFWQMSNGTMR